MEKYICVIGGANVDITGIPFKKLHLKDSNPGKILLSFGGVGRNIAENLSRLKMKVDLISAFGQDYNSGLLREDCIKKKISTNHCIKSKDFSCPTFIAVNDTNGSVNVAISDMDCMKTLTPAYIKRKMPLLNHAQACVLDTNLPKETIKYIINTCKSKIFLDTVSISKTELANDVIKNIFTIKPNILEAEVLANQKISSLYDIKMAAKKILNRNIQNVYISMGDQGVYFDNGVESGIVPSLKAEVVNTSGSGDAFMAALVWANVNGLDITSCAKAGTAAAAICMKSQTAVSSEISEEKLKQLMGEIVL